MSNSKKAPYFFNTETKESSWEPPTALSADEIKALPGADLLEPSSAPLKENITRSKEEAIKILKEYEAQIAGDPQKFKELAKIHSDCSSHEKYGDLGWFGRGQMQKPFEDGAYALEVNQISDIVSSDSGVHLIMRTG
ncbi:hypothetical protein HWV62_10254 [Athelia sp. TMB]|nr:hypothetical protein HWV62_10254 [Athelia sp. TMB]